MASVQVETGTVPTACANDKVNFALSQQAMKNVVIISDIPTS